MNDNDARTFLTEIAGDTMTGPEDDDGCQPILWDAVSLAMWNAIPDKRRFQDSYEHVADTAMNKAFGGLTDGRWLAYGEAMPYIEAYQCFVESEIATLASTHSMPYWLMLCHRIRPDADAIGVTPWTEQSARRVLDAAIFKYGRFGGDDLPSDVVREDGWLRPDLVDESAVSNAYRLERLALELYWSTGAVRRLVKNGWLHISVDGSSLVPLVENSKEDRRLIEQYDKRCTQFDGFTTSSGLITTQEALHHDKGDSPFQVYLPYINSHGYIVPMLWFDDHNRPQQTPFFEGPGVPAPTNYLLGPFDMEPHAKFLVDANIAVDRATPRDIVSLLVTTCDFELKRALWNFKLMREFYQRGYVHVDIDALFLAIVPECLTFRRTVFKETLSMRDCRSGLAAAYDALCLNAAKTQSMSVLHHSACPVFVPVSRTATIINLWSIPYWLEELATAAARTAGRTGTIRGTLLEEAIISRIHNALPDCVLWKKAHEVLKLNDGSLMEIDASYVRGNLLVMIEDKNAVHSEKFEYGAREAPIREFTKFDTDLLKLRSDAAKLLANRTGRNYRLPDEVTAILPIIVTNEVKYIAVDRPDLFLDPDTPVICTIDELVGFLSRTGNSSVARLSCAVR